MAAIDDIEAILSRFLPPGQQAAAGKLARLLVDVTDGRLTQVQAQARLGADAALAEAVRGLAGQRVEVNSKLISFEGAQVGGGISIGDVSSGDIITLSVGTLIGQQTNNYYTYSAPSRSPQEQRNRRAMLTKVRNIWVSGLLERSLTDELRIDLNLVDRPDLLNLPLNAVVQELERPPKTLTPGVPISEVFDQLGGELLILGAPGAGKTTLLLELLRDLLQRAERDEAHPIPVVFPLSTWAAERKPLKDWLVDQLNVIYDVPKKIGQGWVAENEVLPLLDGLDEVATEHRDACVEAVNKYRQDIGGLVPTAVVSRIVDYEALKGRLRLRGAVLVEPLIQQQVESYLARVGEPLRAVRKLMESDPEVMELLDSPLMLSVVTLAFRDASSEILRVEGTVEERRGRLWDSYLERMFTRKGKKTKYNRQQTTRWLVWLAHRMGKLQPFFIEQVQYDCLQSRAARFSYILLDRYISGLVLGLVGGLVGGLGHWIIAWLTNNSTGILNSGVINSAFFFGFSTGISTAFFGGKIGRAALQQRNTLQVIRDIAIGCAVFGLVELLIILVLNQAIFNTSSALFGGMLGMLTGKPGTNPRQVISTEQVSWSWSEALLGGAGGLAIGLGGGLLIILGTEIHYGLVGVLFLLLVFGLYYGLVNGLVSGLKVGVVPISTRSNQGIRRSVRMAIVIGLIICLVLWLVTWLMIWIGVGVQIDDPYFALVYGLDLGLVSGLVGGLVLALAFGGYAVQSHYILRWLLYRQGCLPFLDLIPWLDHCCDRLFLRRVGGGYIFIHRMLLEHFASKYEEPTK